MGFLELTLYKHPSGVAFDPSKVIAKARAAFPEATFIPGDQAAAEAQRAEVFLAEELREDPHGPARTVVASLRRKAKSYGPSFAFTIPVAGSKPIRGLARSVAVGFHFQEPLPVPIRERLYGFLKCLGVGFLEVPKEGGKTHDIVADLRGSSDCLRDGPGVPWLKPAAPATTEVG